MRTTLILIPPGMPFKALLRGTLITAVTNLRSKMRAQKKQVEHLVRQLETRLVDSPSKSNRVLASGAGGGCSDYQVSS